MNALKSTLHKHGDTGDEVRSSTSTSGRVAATHSLMFILTFVRCPPLKCRSDMSLAMSCLFNRHIFRLHCGAVASWAEPERSRDRWNNTSHQWCIIENFHQHRVDRKCSTSRERMVYLSRNDLPIGRLHSDWNRWFVFKERFRRWFIEIHRSSKILKRFQEVL